MAKLFKSQPRQYRHENQTAPMLYFLDSLLWNGMIDINRDNPKKTWILRNVALQEDAENVMNGQNDQQGNDGENEEELGSNEYHQEKKSWVPRTYYGEWKKMSPFKVYPPRESLYKKTTRKKENIMA